MREPQASKTVVLSPVSKTVAIPAVSKTIAVSKTVSGRVLDGVEGRAMRLCPWRPPAQTTGNVRNDQYYVVVKSEKFLKTVTYFLLFFFRLVSNCNLLS